MKIYLSCTANLGDFSNALPVMSGLAKSKNEKIDLIIKSGMRKFNGIKEFLMLQDDLFESVSFDNDIFLYGYIIEMSSWTRFDRNSPIRPIETCRYENWVRDKYGLDFEVDDDFEIKVPKLDIDYHEDKIIMGDRWSEKEDPSIDARRKTYVLKDSGKFDDSKVHYLNYSDDVTTNVSLIKYNPNTLYTTFTGIGIVADLLKKDLVVYWDDDVRMWDGHPVQYDFERHYYGDRNGKLVYIGDA